jgi:hypothetical protein
VLPVPTAKVFVNKSWEMTRAAEMKSIILREAMEPMHTRLNMTRAKINRLNSKEKRQGQPILESHLQLL